MRLNAIRHRGNSRTIDNQAQDYNMAATFPGVCAVVPAAGFGRRMQTECPKQYLSIGNKTILEHAVAALLADARVQRVVIAVSPGDRASASCRWRSIRRLPWWMAALSAPIRYSPACRRCRRRSGCWCMTPRALPASGRPQPPAVALRNQPRRRDPCGASARHHEARRAGQNRYRPYRRPQ